MNSYEFFIDDEEAGERIDKYLASLLPDYSRSYIQKMIADGNVQADGRPSDSCRCGPRDP